MQAGPPITVVISRLRCFSLLAIASFQECDSATALRQLQTALAADPDNLVRKLALAQAYLRNQQADAAIDLLVRSRGESTGSDTLLIAAYLDARFPKNRFPAALAATLTVQYRPASAIAFFDQAPVLM